MPHYRAVTYHAYIMASASGILYVGVTNELERRVTQHKIGEIAGFSSKYKTTKLVYFERYSNIHQAITRERQWKGWRRSKKIALIESINPDWSDLSLDFHP
jgi:putative endonuclease